MFKGERVILRPFTEEDVAMLHEFFQDVEMFGLNCAQPSVYPLGRSRAFYDNLVKEDPHFANFAIEADGKCIGFCSLMGLGDPHGSAELGINIIDRQYWGRGYGRDAIRLLLKYGFHYLGLRRIVLTTHARNPRAIRCYLACGFVEDGRPRKATWVEGEYVDLVNMSILRDEWQS